ncbi:MAG: hypothetical protein LBI74_04625 [Synergistaceae bacterium]|jgi:hypothetical protein|nr:hypothetical protein [Synergistaceae bacterium]
MKRLKALKVLCVFAVVFCFAAKGYAASPEKVFVVDGENWVLKSGGEPEGSCGASLEQGMYWYAVDPDSDEAAKGLRRGVLLYDAEGEKYSFLPTDEEQIRVENVTFSPDKKRMVLSANINRFASGLWVYDVETLELERAFWGYSDVFFVDDVRFAFTLVDEKTERPQQAGMWGISAALYEPAEEKGYVVLKGATAKENFSVTGAGESEITVNVTSVKSEKDWEDIEKWNDSEITLEVPAAG